MSAPRTTPEARRRLAALATLALTLLVGASRPVGAQEDLLDRIQLHGFVSQGYLVSDEYNYLAETTDEGSFEFTEVGLNASVDLLENLRAGLQLFSRDLGDVGNYRIELDWAVLDYTVNEYLGFRVGKFKVPHGLYNEFIDIDSVRVPVLLPQSVYDLRFRETLLSEAGASVYGSLPMGAFGSLDYTAFTGIPFASEQSGVAKGINELEVLEVTDDVAFDIGGGGRLMWNTPLDGLRLGGTVNYSHFSVDTQLTRSFAAGVTEQILAQPAPPQLGLPPGSTLGDAQSFGIDLAQLGIVLPQAGEANEFRARSALTFVASIELRFEDLVLAAEYSRLRIKSRNSHPLLAMAGDRLDDREGGYVAASYRFTEWFQLGTYWSMFHANAKDRRGHDLDPSLPRHRAWQYDLGVTARFDVNEYLNVKLEGHYFNGTAQLFKQDNPGGFGKRDWFLFAIKVSVTF